MPDQSLVSTLKEVGLEDNEARVYLALLKVGKGTASEVAKEADMKRPHVYHIIDRLKKEGYVQEFPDKKVKEFSASSPQKILEDARTAAKNLRHMMPVLRSLEDKGGDKPRIEFFDDKEAIKSVFRMYNQGEEQRYFVTSIERLKDHFGQEVDSWIRKYKSGDIADFGKHLITDTKEDREWAKEVVPTGQEVHILPKDKKMEMDFAIVDDILGITSFDPIFIVVIHSQELANSAAQLFEMAWEMGQDIN